MPVQVHPNALVWSYKADHFALHVLHTNDHTLNNSLGVLIMFLRFYGNRLHSIYVEAHVMLDV